MTCSIMLRTLSRSFALMLFSQRQAFLGQETRCHLVRL